MESRLKRENSDLYLNEEEEEDGSGGEEYEILSRLKPERYIFRMAMKSRFAILICGVLCSSLVNPYDSSTALSNNGILFPFFFLTCPANWDAAFNLRIAANGYEYEESHAFFPFYPFLIRQFSKLTKMLLDLENETIQLTVSGYVLNNILFCFLSVLFYRLSLLVLRNDRMALRAAILFCWNPASIFFTVAYTECTFAFFSFLGILYLLEGTDFKYRLIATVCFSFATLTRFNGCLLGIYSLWAAYKAYLKDESNHRLLKAFVQLGIVGGIHFLSLASVLGYGWYLYCYEPIQESRPWCNKTIPNIYSFVQEKYWNVGLFRYYETKQIPNFILAAPAFVIAISGLITYYRKVPIPFTIQLLFTILTGAFVAHVQVFTRLVCASCPIFFWYAAEVSSRKSASSYFIVMYFAFYTVLGTSMFCAYYPWT